MTTTTHNVAINVTANAQKANQGLLQTKQLLTSMHKGTLRQQMMQSGVAKTMAKQQIAVVKQTKTAGPQQLNNLKQQNQQLTLQNRLLQVQARLWTRIQSAANTAKTKMGFGGGGGKGGKGGKSVPGFGAGFHEGMGFGGPGMSRYGLGQGLARGTRYGLGMAGGGMAALAAMPFQAVSSDYQAYFSYNRQLGGLAGLNKGARFGAGITMPGMDASSKRMAELGYSPEDTIQGMRSFSRATGDSANTELGMTAARVTGMETGEISNIMADLRRAGGGFGEKGTREFQRMLQAAVKGGMDASTLPEYLEGVSSLTARSAGVLGGSVSSAPYAQMLAMFNKSKLAGLQGARGASTLSTLEDMVRHPGGGEEGQAAMMAAMGFGRAGSGVSFYDAKKKQEAGFGKGGSNLRSILDYVDGITGGGELANMYTQELTGGKLSLSQIEEVRKAMGSGATGDQIDEMLAEMTASELDVLQSIDENMRDFLGASKRSAEVQLKDITRGKKYAESMESIQDLFDEWMTFMSGPVKSTLDAIDGGLHVLVPAVQELVEYLDGESKKSMFGSAESVAAATRYRDLRTGSGAEAVANRELLGAFSSDPSQLSEDQLREVAADSMEASDALMAQYNSPSMAQTIGELAQQGAQWAGLSSGGTQADQAASARTAELNRVLVALDILADRLGRGDEVDRTQHYTEQQLITAMQALGVTPPATFRARVDSTGGAP